MSAPLYIPSSTTTAKLAPPDQVLISSFGSYTVPTGKYAKITVIAQDVAVNGSFIANLVTNFSRVLTTSTTTYDPITYSNLNSGVQFVQLIHSSTISNASNSVFAYPTRRFFDLPGTGMNLPAFSYLLAGSSSFTGTTTSMIFTFPDFSSRESTGALSSYPASNGGLCIVSTRVSGQVSFSANVYQSYVQNFIANSGAVISGRKFMVEEYTI